MFELDDVILKDLEALANEINRATHPALSITDAMDCVENANRQIAALTTRLSTLQSCIE